MRPKRPNSYSRDHHLEYKEDPVSRITSGRRMAVAVAIVVMTGTSCSLLPEASKPESTRESARENRFTLSLGIEPQRGLIPAETVESAGHQVLDTMFTGLIEYNSQAIPVYSGHAKKIDVSADAREFTVHLKDGWTFHDGTPVTSKSYVRAWNYVVQTHGANSHYFSTVSGYEDVYKDEEQPSTKTLTGLEVIDERTFKITLEKSFREFLKLLGYAAFYPLPESFYDDPRSFGQRPIGNGPWRAMEKFRAGEGIRLERNPDFAGAIKPKADQLELRVFGGPDEAYLAAKNDTLDVAAVPAASFGKYAQDFPDRNALKDSSLIEYIIIPMGDQRFKDKRARQALSLALDRQAIIGNGSHRPADSLLSPVIPGYRSGTCKYCTQDIPKAQALLAESGFDKSKPVELWFNPTSDWSVRAPIIAKQLKDNLGLEVVSRSNLSFGDLLDSLMAGNTEGMSRYGWVMDYPSAHNYLAPMYSTRGGSNYTKYSNPAVDKLILEGNAATSAEQSIEKYNQAEDILLEELPAIPMSFGRTAWVHSRNVSNVSIDPFGRIEHELVTVK